MPRRGEGVDHALGHDFAAAAPPSGEQVREHDGVHEPDYGGSPAPDGT
jgi:hypothetical protein